MTDYLWKLIGLIVDPTEDVRKLRNHSNVEGGRGGEGRTSSK